MACLTTLRSSSPVCRDGKAYADEGEAPRTDQCERDTHHGQSEAQEHLEPLGLEAPLGMDLAYPLPLADEADPVIRRDPEPPSVEERRAEEHRRRPTDHESEAEGA